MILAYAGEPGRDPSPSYCTNHHPGEINMAQFCNVSITLATFASAAVLLISITAPASASPSSPSDPPLSSATTAVRAQVTDPDTNRTYTPSSTASKVGLNASSGDPIVASYWTPERMKNAMPADTPTSTAEVDRQFDELKQQASANESLTDGSSPVAATSTTITPQAAPPADAQRPADVHRLAGAAVPSAPPRAVLRRVRTPAVPQRVRSA